jgi:hypothetical protein
MNIKNKPAERKFTSTKLELPKPKPPPHKKPNTKNEPIYVPSSNGHWVMEL